MEATVRKKENEEEKGTIRLVSLYLQKEEVFEVLTLFLKAQQTVKFEFPTILLARIQNRQFVISLIEELLFLRR